MIIILKQQLLQKLLIPDFVIKGMYIDGSYYLPTFYIESILCIIGFLFVKKEFAKIMKISHICPDSWAANCYLLISDGEAYVVDPAISVDAVVKRAEELNAEIRGVILTHGHFDHIWRAQELRDETKAPLYVHELDAEMLTDARKNAYRTFTGMNFVINEADILLKDGDTLSLGGEQIKVLHTPGHTKGSVCYDTGDSLLSGDTIFAEGFGRCDLYGGDMNALKNSIQILTKIAESENRWLYSGHGDSSTLRQATERLKYYF